MPSFPPPDSVTICEINRDLITADSLSDDRAHDTYGKILGIVFSPISFQVDQLYPNGDEQERVVDHVRIHGEGAESYGVLKTLQSFVNDSVRRVFRPNYVNLLPEVDFKGVSWHRHKHIIAFISGPNQVTIRDYEDSEAKDACILTCESQRDVKVLEFRPNGGKSLSVACKGGICIWAASYPGNAASVRSGAALSLGTLSRGSGTRWTLVDFLRSDNEEQISALSWSPDGRYP
ncbi:Transducin/WD40 repeat-like superfamily protein [Euphorbia peplus]|nr:Transducin/WD40 repeat-like superfamily protein [Euphorbia peplus]